jgi:riboflavin kinase / FMN adenylyltransferase
MSLESTGRKINYHMEIVKGLENISKVEDCAVTIGTFDGVHPGHLMIIRRLIEVAKERHLCSTLVTFDPHPQLVLNQNLKGKIRWLSSLDDKLSILEQTGLNRTVIIKFDKKLSKRSYEDFVKNILIDKLGTRALIVGYDHAFGKDRQGTYVNLQQLSEKYGFYLEQVEPFRVDGKILSSTFLRNLIMEGLVQESAAYLGRFYSLKGTVVRGKDRGKQLRFPTANLLIENENKIIPKHGVYAVDVEYKNKTYQGMLNIGNQPTFGKEGNFSIEVHIFDFDRDIYGESLTVLFKRRLRDEKKFESAEALITQLEKDKINSLKENSEEKQ